MSALWALLPVKPFSVAKARLSNRLPLAQRQALARAMAGDVVAALQAVDTVERIFICSRGADMAAWAKACGVDFIAEPDAASGLNAAIAHAVPHLKKCGANRLLVAHSDLPCLSTREIAKFVSTHIESPHPAVTIAPDRWDDGSNLLAWDVSLDFCTRYGPGSFQKHQAEAQRVEAAMNICRLAGAAVDVDSETDFDFLLGDRAGLHLGPQTQTFVDDFARSQTPLPVTENNG